MIDKIKKIAEEIFDEMGSGHVESVYQKSFEVALRLENIPYESQRVVPLFYKEHHVGEGIPDLIVNGKEGKIVIELKSISSNLSEKEIAQVLKYMVPLHIKKGILINFPQPTKKGARDEPEIKVIEFDAEFKDGKAVY